ncbi:phage tail sheath C-terminal domain-containing protein [uncultured Psychroserpens sp.]|uniref:phage tail sheath family protein n=1 Tax=uncultured Psychroserpens sp. TaxID=255436 RepID=UPI002620F237|nr:phage tail sheath C-terminal domain-containing protein [uncultured Psychroserpens sp.]
MISSLATPGVYVKEVNAFPPSIAQVATAIPAFIGYTEKGVKDKPTKINSLLEFETHFGGSPAPDSIISINVDAEEYSVDESKLKLYNSLRLFYSNGGGECYIVSVGYYSEKPADWTNSAVRDLFTAGIDKLEKVDEVTLILFPDGINLGDAHLGIVQEHALAQCAELMDRFAIMDVIQSKSDGTSLEDDSLAFRNAVGNKNLKYGAAYYPYLQASFPFQFRFTDIQNNYDFKVSNPSMISKIDAYLALNASVKSFTNNWKAAPMQAHKAKPDAADLPIDDENKVEDYIRKCWSLLALFDDPSGLPEDAAHNEQFNLKIDTVKLIQSSLKPLAQKTFDFEAKFKSLEAAYTLILGSDFDDNDFDDTSWKNGADFAESAPNLYDKLLTSNPEAGDDTESYPLIQGQLNKLHTQIVDTVNGVVSALEDLDSKKESELVSELPDYPKVLSGLSKNMNTIPPSGAIAGIYADVDATRGVWKAPGNVSVSGIIGLTDDINDKEQRTMNKHETGKSINAIRAFTGRGKLVWGARTLDGNSNDWRYINVRRLANMIEESTKKACMNFVFEPNVKQTWVNVKGMISNYLTTLWGDGALAGAKAEDAFFVSVGLGETMDANDINNGRMIVKIGYAPSRPAEFIVLEFTQMQQKS